MSGLWTLVGTGGGCQAWELRLGSGAFWWVTDVSGCDAPPTPSRDTALVGLYDKGGSQILSFTVRGTRKAMLRAESVQIHNL